MQLTSLIASIVLVVVGYFVCHLCVSVCNRLRALTHRLAYMERLFILQNALVASLTVRLDDLTLNMGEWYANIGLQWKAHTPESAMKQFAALRKLVEDEKAKLTPEEIEKILSGSAEE